MFLINGKVCSIREERSESLGRKAYPEEKKSKKGEMKERLRRWGTAMEVFNWKEEELKKLQGLYAMQKKIWEGSETEKARKELERMQKEYEAEARRLRMEMVEILREKAWVDGRLRNLTANEICFLQMRFEKGYGFDYIGVKMFLSRATLFRMQDRILEKMMAEEDETE